MAPRLPLFPLDAVLFPGTRISLHIFEPRYRALVHDALKADGRFVLLAPGPDGTPPESGTIGTVALVAEHHLLPDGRSNILLLGEERCILRGLEADTTPYLIGRLALFGDEEGVDDLAGDLVASLRHLGARCRHAMTTLTDTVEDGPWSESLGELTFQVAAAMPWGPEEARPLLAMRSPTARAERLLRVLPAVVQELEGRAAVHVRAHTNGHGPYGKHGDIAG
jgi:Lon protease-like protein